MLVGLKRCWWVKSKSQSCITYLKIERLGRMYDAGLTKIRQVEKIDISNGLEFSRVYHHECRKSNLCRVHISENEILISVVGFHTKRDYDGITRRFNYIRNLDGNGNFIRDLCPASQFPIQVTVNPWVRKCAVRHSWIRLKPQKCAKRHSKVKNVINAKIR